MDDLEKLKNLVLAPYILKATALIKIGRKVGGNQFRHSFSTLGILLDYRYFHNSVLLKGSLLHDFLEDLEDSTIDEIRKIDTDGPFVVDLILEVTRKKSETKNHYLSNLLKYGTNSALILKCADRISNLTDLHLDTHTRHKISDYLDQTEEFVIPMAEKVNRYMKIELSDLIKRRRSIL